MCGIAAILKFKESICSADQLNRMKEAVGNRGPDDSGGKLFFLFR
jgi:asparagine synthetase B (glutamine-hydrolysing)